MENLEEQLVNQFLHEQTTEIPDNGFSQRVMNALPDNRERRLNHLWVALCTLIGVAAFYFGHGWIAIRGMFQGLMADIFTSDWSLWQNPLTLIMCAIFMLMVLTSYRLMQTA